MPPPTSIYFEIYSLKERVVHHHHQWPSLIGNRAKCGVKYHHQHHHHLTITSEGDASKRNSLSLSGCLLIIHHILPVSFFCVLSLKRELLHSVYSAFTTTRSHTISGSRKWTAVIELVCCVCWVCCVSLSTNLYHSDN